jgi:hypothetical protein
MNQWTVLVNYGSGFDADFAVEQLRSAGIQARARGNDIVGIFGAGFQGVTARGVDVLVPSDSVEQARDVLGLSNQRDDD